MFKKLFFVSIVFIIILTGCGDKVKVIKATIYSDAQQLEYTDEATMELIETIVNSTKRENGTTDVGPPEYKIILDYNDDKTLRYDLHLNTSIESGYIIKGSLGNIFRLKDKDAKKLIELIKKGS